MLLSFIKNIVKKIFSGYFNQLFESCLKTHLYTEFNHYNELKDKSSIQNKVNQHVLFNQYKETNSSSKLVDTNLSIFSQDNEDGIILQIFSKIGFGSKSFIEIGSGNGTLFSNCANLCVHFGFDGIFIDCNEKKLNEGVSFYKNCFSTYLNQPKFVQAFVSKENINSIIDTNYKNQNVDLLSIDIDGNDYWILDQLKSVRPRVIVLEINPFFANESVSVKYNPSFSLENINENIYGMSALAAIKLCKQKEYKLVATNSKGFNLFFVDNQESSAFEAITPNEIFQKRYFREHSGGFIFNDEEYVKF